MPVLVALASDSRKLTFPMGRQPCLCFELGSTSRIFTNLLRVSMSLIIRLNTLIIIYLHGMLLLRVTNQDTLIAEDTAILLLQNLSTQKVYFDTNIQFSGLLIDPVQLTLLLTPQKKYINSALRCAEYLKSLLWN